MRKRLWMLLSCVTLVLCMALGAAACGDEEAEKTALSVPQNVKVSEGTLFWDPVEHAEGYTVKINSDESTVVNGESLKLSTVASKLRNGANSLSVRANETAEYAASDYSAAVSYNYTPQETGKVKLGTPMGVAVHGDSLTWETVLNASGYTVRIGEDETTTVTANSLDLTTVAAKLAQGPNALSVKATGTGNYTDGDYSSAVEYIHRVPFAAPQNLRVDVSTLRWDAVDGAASYTVKINSDETTIVTTAELDLTTVTDKLVLDNKLSVKVNSNEVLYLTESDYSAEVDFRYNAEAIAKAKAFEDTVTAITTLTQDNTQEEAAAAKTAIEAAEAAFAALDDEAKEYAEAAKTALDAKKAAYTEQTEGAQTAHSAFAAYLLAAEEEMNKEESAATLEEKIEAAKTAKGELSTLAGGLVTAEETGRIQTLDGTLSAWKAEIAEAVETLGAGLPELDPDNDATAEEIIPAADGLLGTYETFETYVKADEQVEAKRASLAALQAAAKEQIETSVETLKAELADALENHAEASVENYRLLLALEARISSLGDYAKTLFDVEENSQSLAAAKENMMKQVVAVEKNEKVLYNSDRGSEDPVFTLVLKYVNVAGENMKLDEDPTVTVEEQVDAEEKRTLTPSDVTYDETNGIYVVRVSFTNVFKDKKAVTLTYTVNDSMEGGTETLALGDSGGIVYFANGTSEAYSKNKLTLYGGTANQETLIEAYLTEDIVKASGNESIEIKGLPFACGTKDDFDNPESLRYFAAKAGLTGTVSVSLLAYQRWEEDGKIRVSVINSASVSAPIELNDVNAEDAREHLPMPKFNGAVELNIQEAVRDGSLAALLGLESLTNGEASQLVRLHVQVTHNGETKDYFEPLSSDWVHSKILEEGTMKQVFFELFNDLEGAGYEVTIRLAFVEGSPYADKIGESYPIYYSFEGSLGGGKLVPDLNNGAWGLGDGNGDINFKQQVVTTDGSFHDGALIYIYDTNGIEDPQTYDFSQATPYAVYHINVQAAVSWNKSNGKNSALNEVIRLAWIQQLKEAGTTLEDIEYPTYRFVFAIALVPNAEGEKFGYTASDLVYATKDGAREVKEYTFTENDVKAPKFAQFNFAGDNVEYLKPTEGLGRGDIFSVEKAAYVELKFTKGDASYSVFLFEENGKVVIYKDKDKTGDSLSVGDVSNSWGSANDLSNKIKAWYGLDSMDIRDGWSYSTKVYVGEESLYFVDGEWSEPVEHNLG